MNTARLPEGVQGDEFKKTTNAGSSKMNRSDRHSFAGTTLIEAERSSTGRRLLA
jgi:hypothetical protein